MWRSLEVSTPGQDAALSDRVSRITAASYTGRRRDSDSRKVRQDRSMCPGMSLSESMSGLRRFTILGRGTRPRPLGPAYFPPASFFSSFGSSASTTWPPLSLDSSFLSSLNTTTWPPLSFFSSFLSSEATARVDIALKLRNATKAINPLNRFIRPSMDGVRLVIRPRSVHDRYIAFIKRRTFGTTDKCDGQETRLVQCITEPTEPQ